MSFSPGEQFVQPPGPSEELIHASARRIVRWPGTTIQFAAFDPCTATGDQLGASAFQKLSLNEELCRPKRIVIETSSDGRCTWRFVPNARREHGVENEGFWPRVVLFHGQPLTLTQDHWDFFKLDRELVCVVRSPPQLSTIDPRTDAPSAPTPAKPAPFPVSPKATPILGAKRRASESTLSRQPSGSNSDGQRMKKARSYVEDHVSSTEGNGRGGIAREDEADEEEVNDMVIDEGPRHPRRQASARLRKVRANNEEARQKCKQARDRRKAQKTQVVDDDDDDKMSWSECPAPEGPSQAMSSPASKRKVECFSDAGEESGGSDKDDVQKPHFKPYEKTGQNKRYRTASPFAVRNQIGMKRHKRATARKEEIDRRKQARSEALNAMLMKAIYEEAAEELAQSDHTTVPSENGTGPIPRPPSPHIEHSATSAGRSPSPSPEQNQFDQSQGKQSRSSQETLVDSDEAQRRAAIEESRRKIAELEKDRPLWEEQARRRAAREAEEKAAAEARGKARLAEQESSSQKAEIGQKSAEQQAKNKEEERRRKSEEERRAREDAAAQLREKRKRARETAIRKAQTLLSSRSWNKVTALDHYMNLSESFDKLNFFKGDVIVFETIPWPILSPPGSFSVEDIDWQAVETFFREIQLCCSMEEYKAVVVMSHKRFHPDRWSARKVLGCVEDEVERECLDAAAKTVAQALTPIWEKVTGR